MTKICIMGNSHVGALKRGWDEIHGDCPTKQIVFFAHRANGLDGLIPQDGKLIPNNEELANALEFTSGGKNEIDPKEYDVLVIYASGATVNFNFGDRFYTKAAVRRGLNDFVENTLAFKILKRLRIVTNKNIFIGHTPLAAAEHVLSTAEPVDYITRVKLINDVIYRPLNCEMVLQPLITIVNGKNTHPDFSKGSKRLAIGDYYDNEYHPEDDNAHMNDKFGEIWLRQFFDKYVEKI